MSNFYTPKERSAKQVINEKIHVLRDFCIVDDTNEDSIRIKLTSAINNEPNKDPDIVADRLSRAMIMGRLSE